MCRWNQRLRFERFGVLRRASGGGRASDWTVTGPDRDGDDLEVAVVLEDGILVITVY